MLLGVSVLAVMFFNAVFGQPTLITPDVAKCGVDAILTCLQTGFNSRTGHRWKKNGTPIVNSGFDMSRTGRYSETSAANSFSLVIASAVVDDESDYVCSYEFQESNPETLKFEYLLKLELQFPQLSFGKITDCLVTHLFDTRSKSIQIAVSLFEENFSSEIKACQADPNSLQTVLEDNKVHIVLRKIFPKAPNITVECNEGEITGNIQLSTRNQNDSTLYDVTWLSDELLETYHACHLNVTYVTSRTYSLGNIEIQHPSTVWWIVLVIVVLVMTVAVLIIYFKFLSKWTRFKELQSSKLYTEKIEARNLTGNKDAESEPLAESKFKTADEELQSAKSYTEKIEARNLTDNKDAEPESEFSVEIKFKTADEGFRCYVGVFAVQSSILRRLTKKQCCGFKVDSKKVVVFNPWHPCILRGPFRFPVECPIEVLMLHGEWRVKKADKELQSSKSYTEKIEARNLAGNKDAEPESEFSVGINFKTALKDFRCCVGIFANENILYLCARRYGYYDAFIVDSKEVLEWFPLRSRHSLGDQDPDKFLRAKIEAQILPGKQRVKTADRETSDLLGEIAVTTC